MAGVAIRVNGARRTSRKLTGISKRMKNMVSINGTMGERIITDAQTLIEQRRLGDVATGSLGNSLRNAFDERGGSVSTRLVYASVQQHGGTIKPKPGGKNLAIPATKGLRQSKLWPRDFPDDALEWRPAKKIAGVLVRADTRKIKRDAGGKAVRFKSGEKKGQVKRVGSAKTLRGSGGAKVGDVMFLLVPQVTIRDRGPFLQISETAQREYMRNIARWTINNKR